MALVTRPRTGLKLRERIRRVRRLGSPQLCCLNCSIAFYMMTYSESLNDMP